MWTLVKVSKKFNTIDNQPIIDYLSPIGNSAVPYPFALSSTYAYLMIEDKAIPTTEISANKPDPYLPYYEKQARGVQSYSSTTLVPRP